jgi:uncharacterized alpha-E superfamily protein
MLLSRVAENVYWMARYLERAEDTARLINSMTSLLLDMPRDVELGWFALVKVINADELYDECYPDKRDERSVMRFLISDTLNPSSIVTCINAARENARVTRDIVPNEVWEQANELFHYTGENAKTATGRRKRNDFMSGLIRRCQTMIGIMMGTIPHDDAYQFLRIGRNLERADMSSRILDVAAANLLSEEEEFHPAFATVRWISVLRTLNAFQAYRRQGYLGVNGSDVLEYLLKEGDFPRSMGHSLTSIGECLSALPNPRGPRRHLNQLAKVLEALNTRRIRRSGLHRFIDDFQIGVGKVHESLTNTYFRDKG